MNKIKLLTISVIGLLFLNIGIICFLIFSKPTFENKDRRNENRKPKEFIVARLHFDANQIKQYDQIITFHRKKIDSLDSNIKGLKSELYSKLQGNSINTKVNDSLINLIVINQKSVEETHLKHFQDIKKLCHKEQLNDFSALTNDLGKLFSNNKKEPRRDSNQKPPRDENYPRPPRGEHPPRPDGDGNFPPPPRRDLNHNDPRRDENRPPPPPWDENHPRRPGDENRPPPRPDDEQ